MDRILIVPAAGRGSRLGASIPKALVTVAGRPMLDHLLHLHREFIDRAAVVVSPEARSAFVEYASHAPVFIDIAVQPEPTGMLDAILLAADVVARRRPRRIAITWCDQIGITPETVRTLAALCSQPDAPALVFPTFECAEPYIHFDRDARRRIIAVRQRRERDDMPPRGETDMGLFDLSARAFTLLAEFASSVETGRATRERNFLPFIPWLAARERVETFSGRELIETVGVNTPEELAAVERHLQRRTVRG